MIRFEQRVEGVCEGLGGGAVGCVVGERRDDEPEGALDLAVGQQVRAVSPVGDDPEPPLLGFGEREQRLVDSAQVCRAAGGGDEQHPEQQRAHRQLPGADPDRQPQLDPAAHAGGVDHRLQALERVLLAHGDPPSSATNSASAAVGSWAARSPRRCEHEIPAACMNARRPIRSAHATSQVVLSRPA